MTTDTFEKKEQQQYTVKKIIFPRHGCQSKEGLALDGDDVCGIDS